MADLLGVTNPVPGYDSASTNRTLPINPNDPHIQNIPDPTRVGRPDARTDQQDTADQRASLPPRYGSNLQTFLQRLRETPDLMQAMTRLLMGRGGAIVSSGIGEGLAADISRFLEMLQLDQTQLQSFLETQMSSTTRFGGPLFSALRGIFDATESESLREDILNFVKKYGDYSSTRHIEGNLLRNLNRMARSIPASWGGKLIELAAQLENGVAAGDRAGNLKLLQGQIVPYMAEYTSRTHDLGIARTLLTLLTLDITRYENGSEDGLIQAYRQLGGYSVVKDRLGGLGEDALLRLLRDSPFARSSEENLFADHFSSAAARALRGEGGADLQDAFRSMVNAFLVNESVYMPLNHLVIPLEWNERMMFSELWVDPDADDKDGERRKGGDGEGAHTTRFLFKMDIQGLGAFDVVLTCREGNADLRVRCPERISSFSGLIQEDLSHILADNGFQDPSVQVEQLVKPLTISEVFPHIFDGKGGVDVIV